MPTTEQIDEWKRQFGNVYQIDEYIFRAISVAEHEAIHAQRLDRAEIEEQIVLAAVLWPEEIDLDGVAPGVISALADEVTDISGFGDPKVAKGLLDEERANLGNVFTLMKAIVLAAMPAYTEEHLDSLAFPVLMSKVVLAEEVIKVQQAILGGGPVQLELLDPEVEAEKERQAAQRHSTTKRPGQAVFGDPTAERLRRALQ